MISEPSTSTTGLLLSGGLDSCILLGHLLDQGERVLPFYVRSHLIWESAELAAVERYLGAMARPDLEELQVLDLPLDDLYRRHWSVTGSQTPDAESSDEAVFLPGRNAFLLIKPVVWCQLHGIERLALGVLRSNPFDDATADFFDDFESALGRCAGPPVRLIRPFARLSKRRVMELGQGLPLEFTFSCISPVDGLHCGQCNKCAERRTAFRLVDAVDPTEYVSPAVSMT